MGCDDMNTFEVIKSEISRYMELLRIERDMNGATNNALTDALTECKVTLQSLGVNVDGLKLS